MPPVLVVKKKKIRTKIFSENLPENQVTLLFMITGTQTNNNIAENHTPSYGSLKTLRKKKVPSPGEFEKRQLARTFARFDSADWAMELHCQREADRVTRAKISHKVAKRLLNPTRPCLKRFDSADWAMELAES